jgi:hypothetical protein
LTNAHWIYRECVFNLPKGANEFFNYHIYSNIVPFSKLKKKYRCSKGHKVGFYFSSGFQFRDGNCRENLCKFLSENVISRRNVAQNFPVPKLKTRLSLTGFLKSHDPTKSRSPQSRVNFPPEGEKNFSFFRPIIKITQSRGLSQVPKGSRPKQKKKEKLGQFFALLNLGRPCGRAS